MASLSKICQNRKGVFAFYDMYTLDDIIRDS